MDAAWMLVFVVPGIAALVVDFATGAIYLPDGKKQFLESRAGDGSTLLVLRSGAPITIRSPRPDQPGPTWEFRLARIGETASLAAWSWPGGDDFVIDMPEGVAAGQYTMPVLRDDAPVGELPVRVVTTAQASPHPCNRTHARQSCNLRQSAKS